ncbi:MAG: response regulator [Deltaproteobacteria bacterium]|nr:response regulator [Deltaproteobacteria bacterium]
MTEKTKILVVDDDRDFLAQTAGLLRDRGYDVIEASSRAEAEETLLRVQPALAVLDLMMEEMDSGFVLCHTIKRLYPEMPVILLTAVTSEMGFSFKTHDERGRAWVEVDLTLDKPVRPETLQVAVAKLLADS